MISPSRSVVDQLSIRLDSRFAFVGKTGSGKTTLAGYLLQPAKRLVVFDPKGTLYGRWRLVDADARKLRLLRRGDDVRLRIGPESEYSDALELVLEAGMRKPLTVYVDETYGLLRNGRAPDGLIALATRGREHGIGLWIATQRPSWIPLHLLSEAEWFAQFRLQLTEDRKRMASLIGSEALQPIQGHDFLLYHIEWEHPRLVRVRLPRKET